MPTCPERPITQRHHAMTAFGQMAGKRPREYGDGADHAENATKLQAGLEKRAALVERQEAQIECLREELDRLGDAAQDRDLVVGRISGRYTELLSYWRYPKLSQPMIDTNLVPHVRGDSYREASSGARTLLTLAWQLAVFEVAVETSAAHPGFLMIKERPERACSWHVAGPSVGVSARRGDQVSRRSNSCSPPALTRADGRSGVGDNSAPGPGSERSVPGAECAGRATRLSVPSASIDPADRWRGRDTCRDGEAARFRAAEFQGAPGASG
ncbi:hypothetical protein M2167_007787 [Streptomyces sp. SPB4]|nr:hypothetical protein [Streptomyces sp. SPB4]